MEFSDALYFVAVSGPFGALLFFVPLWAPWLIFRGLGLPGGDCNPRRNAFSVADAGVLITFLAIANALTISVRHEFEFNWLIALGVCANSLGLFVWIRCLKFMKDRQIVCPRSRFVLQVFLYPLVILAMSYAIMTGMMLASGIIDAVAGEWDDQNVMRAFLAANCLVFLPSLGAIVVARPLFRTLIRVGGDGPYT